MCSLCGLSSRWCPEKKTSGEKKQPAQLVMPIGVGGWGGEGRPFCSHFQLYITSSSVFMASGRGIITRDTCEPSHHNGIRYSWKAIKSVVDGSAILTRGSQGMGFRFRAQGWDLRCSAETAGHRRTPQIKSLSSETNSHSLRPSFEDCRKETSSAQRGSVRLVPRSPRRRHRS